MESAVSVILKIDGMAGSISFKVLEPDTAICLRLGVVASEDKIALGHVDDEGSSHSRSADYSFQRKSRSIPRFEQSLDLLHAILMIRESHSKGYGPSREAFALVKALMCGFPVDVTTDDEIRAQLCGIVSDICAMCLTITEQPRQSERI